MQEVREVSFRYGHAWFGKLPNEFFYQPSRFVERTLSRSASTVQERQSVCLKLMFITEPIHFGVLGVQFTPSDSNLLYIRVGILDWDENTNTAPPPGIPEEYTQSVLETSFATLIDAPYLGSGILQFNHAAWHLVDSNQRMFKALAKLLILLLAPQHAAITKSEMETLSLAVWNS